MRLSDFDLAETCMEHAKDYSGLLLLCTAAGKDDKLAALAKAAHDDEKTNIAFISMLLRGKVCTHNSLRSSHCISLSIVDCVVCGPSCMRTSHTRTRRFHMLTTAHGHNNHLSSRQVSECVDLLVETNRLPEAALFARSYCPSRIKDVLAAWKEDVGKANDKAARMIADPEEYANLFPELTFTTSAEQQIAAGTALPPASHYRKVVAEREVPLAERLSGGGGGASGGGSKLTPPLFDC